MPAPQTSGGSSGARRPGRRAVEGPVERRPREAGPPGRPGQRPGEALDTGGRLALDEEVQDAGHPGTRSRDVDDGVSLQDADAPALTGHLELAELHAGLLWWRGRDAGPRADRHPADAVTRGGSVGETPRRASSGRGSPTRGCPRGRGARSYRGFSGPPRRWNPPRGTRRTGIRRISFADVVGRLERDNALHLEQLVGQTGRQVEEPLAAPLHRTNPRSRASFSLVLVNSCR